MKKLAAVLDLNAQELKYLLHALDNLNRLYNSGSRDYDREESHDKLKDKLQKAQSELE